MTEKTEELLREKETKNYVKYSASDDMDVAEFSSVHIPKEEIDNESQLTVTVSFSDN